MVNPLIGADGGRPIVIVVDSAEEGDQVVKALLALGEHEGVLAPAPHGWMVVPRTNGTRVYPRGCSVRTR